MVVVGIFIAHSALHRKIWRMNSAMMSLRPAIGRDGLSRRAILTLALLVGIGCSAWAPPTQAEIDPSVTVFNREPVRQAILRAQQRRIDFVGVGDSNQIFGGDFGWDHGYQKAWSDTFGMYATGILPFAGNNLSSWPAVGVNYRASSLGAGGWSAATPPPQLNQYVLTADGTQNFPRAYLEDSDSISSSQTHYQLVIENDAPFNISDRLLWHYTYGTFESGSGRFAPSARNVSTTTFHTTTETAPINAATGSFGLADGYLELPAAARQSNFGFEPFKVLSGNSLEGPFFAQYQRLEIPSVTQGVALSTFLAQGGKSLRHAATSMQEQQDSPAMTEWLRQLVRLQGDDPVMVVHIQHGGNDRNDRVDSVGLNPAPSNSGEGFVDNLKAFIDAFRSSVVTSGYSTDQVYFIVTYHPQAGAFESDKLVEFEEAAINQVASTDNHVAIVRGSKLITPSLMQLSGWYDSLGDAHLTQAGYEGFAQLVTDAILTPQPDGLTLMSVLSGILLLRRRS